MYWKNLSAPEDKEETLNFGSSTGGAPANGQYDAVAFGTTAYSTWGVAFSSGSTGCSYVIKKELVGGGWEWSVQIITPWGSYSPASVLGNITSGQITCYISQYALSVSTTCAWSFSFASMVFKVNGTTVLTIGAQTVSGSGYDERQNILAFSPDMPVVVPGPLTCGDTAYLGNASDFCTASGGYVHGPTGMLVADAVSFDSTASAGACTCLQTPPAIGGSNSNNVSVSVAVSANVTATNGTASCACGTPHTVNWTQYLQISTYTQETISIHASSVSCGQQNEATSWACDNPSGSGSTSSTTTPGSTTCTSSRAVQYFYQQTNACITTVHPPGCDVGCYYPLPAGTVCAYVGNATLTWPTPPTCAPGEFLDLTSGENGMLYRSVTSSAGISLVRYNFADVNEMFSAFSGTALHGTIACGPKDSLIITFDDGTTCYAIASTNSGQNWSSPVSIAAGTWPKCAVDQLSATEFCVLYNGTQYVCWRKTTSDSSFQNVGTIATAPAGGGGLSVRGSVQVMLIFEITNSSGSVDRYVSVNMGVNWTLT